MENKDSYDFLIKEVSQNIKKHRKRNALKQEDMTEHGFNYKHYQKIEGGKHSMSLYTLYRLAKAFKTDINSFLNKKPSKRAK